MKARAEVSPEAAERFGAVMRGRLLEGDTPAREACIGALAWVADRSRQLRPGKPPAFINVPNRIVARWAERSVTGIRRRDIIALLDESLARRETTTANRELSALSRFFSWCCERDILEVSPTMGVRKPSPENQRERVLTDAELVLIWKASLGRDDLNHTARVQSSELWVE